MSKRINDRASKLKKRYNLTLEQYDAFLTSQGGVCAICHLPDEKRLNIDHCHETNVVRGLLCGKCNRALGSFNDSIDNLLAAVSYLYHRQRS